MSKEDWGICQRCYKPAKCGMSYVEIDRDGYDICEPCHLEMWEVLRKWFRMTGDKS